MLHRKKVLVLGGGFAGLNFCKAMRGQPGFEITLIDRQNHHLFQPLLYQVATAGLSAVDIAQPLRAILANQSNLLVVMEEVQKIDLAARVVTTAEDSYPYDYLVIGLGVRTGFFGRDEWGQHAIGLKTLHDAQRIRQRLLMAFERAEQCEDEEERKRLMRIVIVGGGPTGVELAGACADLTRLILRDNFRTIDPSSAEIILVESSAHVLDRFPEPLSLYAEEKLQSMGVKLRRGCKVQAVEAGRVNIAGEQVPVETVLWAAGVQAPAITKDLPVEKDKAGRLVVQSDLSLAGYPEVFAVGDIARCKDVDGVDVPGVAPAAMQMGKHVAKLLVEEQARAGTATPLRRQFRYRDKGSLATIGRKAAVGLILGKSLSGTTAWLAWLGIHLLSLIGLRNKLAVLLQWFYSYIRYKNGARVIMTTEDK